MMEQHSTFTGVATYIVWKCRPRRHCDISFGLKNHDNSDPSNFLSPFTSAFQLRYSENRTPIRHSSHDRDLFHSCYEMYWSLVIFMRSPDLTRLYHEYDGARYLNPNFGPDWHLCNSNGLDFGNPMLTLDSSTRAFPSKELLIFHDLASAFFFSR